MTAIARCRSCGSHELTPILSLGATPLANALLTREQLELPEAVFPLDLVLCLSCSLVQITETVPPEKLFSEYLYFSSYSDTMLRHARALVERVLEEETTTRPALVVEIASNDGYLLQYYQASGVPVLGIEPARNIAEVAQERGIPTVCEFFGSELAQRLAAQSIKAGVLHAHNVLAHVPDLNGFVEGIRILLASDGFTVIEAPYVQEMMEGVEFDTIYHEHLCYFSLTALDHLFRRHFLRVHRVERIPIHGGSLRLFVSPEEAQFQVDSSVEDLLQEERAWGVSTPEPYLHFAAQVQALRAELQSLITGLKQDGKRLAAYGASAKGSTLLNYLGVGRETLEFVADRSDVKQGRYTPGTRLPVLSQQALVERQPDYTLLLTWNFAEEILEQQREYRERGGHFIIPVPRPRIV